MGAKEVQHLFHTKKITAILAPKEDGTTNSLALVAYLLAPSSAGVMADKPNARAVVREK
jgi:hypothetical protein